MELREFIAFLMVAFLFGALVGLMLGYGMHCTFEGVGVGTAKISYGNATNVDGLGNLEAACIYTELECVENIDRMPYRARTVIVG